MTAYARAASPVKEGGWQAEIRSINSRYFEFSLKISPALNALENRVREMAQASMRRGKVTLSIFQEGPEDRVDSLGFDEKKISFYLTQIKKVKKKYKIQGELTISDLVKLPGIIGVEENSLDAEKVWPSLKKVLTKALEEAKKAKRTEGAKLAKDIEARLQSIAKAVNTIEKETTGRAERLKAKLVDKIQALVSDKTLDADRLEREVAFMAERTDITEEIVRLRSHLDLFKKRLQQENEVGKELDFLCQELNREINTMGSKSQHFEISTEVVFVKGELEKIREQIQNIE
jgi:uncharacterized protein (TIGR00255 family)